MTEIMRRRRALMGAQSGGGGHGLPVGYQEVEYIRATGTQYLQLSTTIYSSEYKKYKIEVTASFGSGISSTTILCGIGSGAGCWLGTVNGGQNVGIGASSYFTGIVVTDKHQYILDYAQDNTTIATCDGGQEISRGRSTNGGSLALFAAVEGTASYQTKGDIFSAKVYYDGLVNMELYPCYRKSDGVIGMYDKTNDRFFVNSGTGTFIKGADV